MKFKVVEALIAAKNVAIYTHINVDSDAMGSSLALKDVLESLGKQVDVYVNSDFPNNFKFYGNLDFINKRTCVGKYDTVICLDTAGESRIGRYKYTYKKDTKNTVLIDHHYEISERFCKINYVKQASSTAEILFEIFDEMKVKLSNYACKCLLSGIVTDTGRFAHSATCQTFKTVAELLKISGLKMEDIYNELLNVMSMNVFALLRHAYNTMEFYAGGKLAIMMFRCEDFIKNGTTMDELDAFPDIPLSLENVKFSILASEDERGFFRVSLRSKGDVSARAVAEFFGGGGHFNASGCRVYGSYEEVKNQLINGTTQVLGWAK